MDIKTLVWIFLGDFLVASWIIVLTRIFKKKISLKFYGNLLFGVIVIPILAAVIFVNAVNWPVSFFFGVSFVFCVYGFIINLVALEDYRDKRVLSGLFIIASSLNAVGAVVWLSSYSSSLSLYQAFNNIINTMIFIALISLIAFITYLNFLNSHATWVDNKK